MPTILIVDGIKVQVFKEGRHKFAHVHAFKGGAEAKIRLDNGEVYYVRNFSQKDVKQIKEFVIKNAAILAKEWERLNSED